MIICGMCGHPFAYEEGVACSTCPFAAGCALVKCPRCGFEFPPESKLVSLAARIVRRLTRSSELRDREVAP